MPLSRISQASTKTSKEPASTAKGRSEFVANPAAHKAHKGGTVPIESKEDPGTFEQVEKFAGKVNKGAKKAQKGLEVAGDAGVLDSEDAKDYSEDAQMLGEDAGAVSAVAGLGSMHKKSVGDQIKQVGKVGKAIEKVTDEESVEYHQELYDKAEDQAGELGEALSEMTAPAAQTGAEVLDSMASTFSYWGGDALANSDWVTAFGEGLNDTAATASTYANTLYETASHGAEQVGAVAMEAGQQIGENAQPLLDAAAPVIEVGGDVADALGLDAVGAVEAVGKAVVASGNAGCYALYRQTLSSAQQMSPQDKDLHKAIEALMDRTEVLESLSKSGQAVATGIAKGSGVPGAGLAMKAATGAALDPGPGADEVKRMPSGVMKKAMLSWTNAEAAAKVYRVAEAMDSNGSLKVMAELKQAQGELEGERKDEFDEALGHASAYLM